MSLTAEKVPTQSPRIQDPHVRQARRLSKTTWAYALAVVIGLLLLELFEGASYLVAATVLAIALFVGVAMTSREARSGLFHVKTDRLDLFVMTATYAAVVGLFRVAFNVIEDQDMLLFAFMAAGLLVGVAVPVIYTVWGRGRSLRTLGLSTANLPKVATLALMFAAVQFAITFWGFGAFPGTRGVATLLVMALMVGIFETIFFRGFVQGRLEASLGTAPAVLGAAVLYGAYHVGYGMGLEEVVFLAGLGIVYALAYATTNNFFIMWPLLTPMGSFFAQLDDGELAGRLPWASVLGFADVIAVFAVIIWFARKHEKKIGRPSGPKRVAALNGAHA